jgi:type 1 glutamine amidotransferase
VTAHRYGRGRVCYVQFGHDLRAWASTGVRAIVAGAARWLAEPASVPTRPTETEDSIPL